MNLANEKHAVSAGGPSRVLGTLSRLAHTAAGSIAPHIICGLLGLLCARGIVFARYAPFGVAAVAAAPYSSMWAAVLGGITGYLMPGNAAVPIHYIAAVLACAAIRWTLSDLLKLRAHPAFAPLAAGLPALTTALAVAFVNGSPGGTTALFVAEAFLSAGAAYFFSRTVSTLRGRRRSSPLNIQESSCLLISLGILLIALSELSVAGISLGHIAAVLAVLYASRYGGPAGGAVAGIASGAAFGMATTGLSYISGAYALGGLVAGIFSPVGRLAAATAFVLANAIASLQVGGGAAVTTGLYEVAIATVLYLALPSKFGAGLAALFSESKASDRSEELRGAIVRRLDYAAKALDGVSDAVEEVSKKLELACMPDVGVVYEKTIREVCSGCGLKLYCWDKNYHENMERLLSLSPALKEKGYVLHGDFPEAFSTHCSRMNQVSESISRHYLEFSAREAAERRVSQIRALAVEQFGMASRILEDLSGDLELFERIDTISAQKITEILRTLQINPLHVNCCIDSFGRLRVEAELTPQEKGLLDRPFVAKEASRACGRTFDLPVLTAARGNYRLAMAERPAFRIRTGYAQHICGNGKLCGDSCECFSDGSGRQIALISDGMGNGGRAAVDAAMAGGLTARLLQTGIGADACLKIVNSALLVKAGDESLATLDLALIDLFQGTIEFYKAGSPLSVLRTNGHTSVIDTPSLPIGILNETHFSKSSATVDGKGLLVLMSDGALAAGEDWVIDAVDQFQGQLPQELAEELVGGAISRRDDGHDDDITVLVAAIEPLRERSSP